MSSHTQAKGLPSPRPLVKQASTFTSCGMWSEGGGGWGGGHRAIFRSLLYFSVTAVCLLRQSELLAISSGQAEVGSSEANLSKQLAPAQATGRRSGWMIYCCRCSKPVILQLRCTDKREKDPHLLSVRTKGYSTRRGSCSLCVFVIVLVVILSSEANLIGNLTPYVFLHMLHV